MDEFYNNITISDDMSADSKIRDRNLHALRDPVDNPSEPRSELRISRNPMMTPGQQIPGDHPALNDYQMQLMLLEQQNKRRLLLARQEHDNMEIQSTKYSAFSDGNLTATVMGAESSTSGAATPATEKASVVDLQKMERHLRNALTMVDGPSWHLQQLQDYLGLLLANAQPIEVAQKEQAPFRHQILHRIHTKEIDQSGKSSIDLDDEYSLPYFDHPERVQGEGNASRIHCKMPLTNFDLYLEKNKNVNFIVYRNFDPDSTSITSQPRTDNATDEGAAHLPKHTSESIRPINRNLIEAIKALLNSRKEYAELLNEYSSSNELRAPYLFIYHSRHNLDELENSLPSSAKSHLSLLANYVLEQYADEYAAADYLLSQNKISPEYIPYLFKPGDVLVSREDGQYTGYVALSWPQISNIKGESGVASLNSARLPLYVSQDAAARMTTEKVTVHVCTVRAWHWAFDGSFQRQYTTLRLEIPVYSDEFITATNAKNTSSVERGGKKHKSKVVGKHLLELNVFPIEYASADIVEKCRRRGKTFWKCRNRRFVSYRNSDMESIQTMVHERYMIDLKTYNSLHPNTVFSNRLRDELGPEAMARDEPPDEQFELLLPLKIKGYNLRRKKWFDLVADRIDDVTWNKEAFKNLVIDRKAGDLIRALVGNQLATEKGTDLIMGKGNGLILLLHGGPGTGKTLTAESVAEIAEKPLYRVTCGDVGTKAEDVERYLESVLHLGKIWGCVVLLDEADVFLEQRGLEDLERNALVSVFLRVLEYYEGILVLTSNRVGTFDEAFKSRIQLALHYPVLGPYQRMRIWENFINRLKSFGDDGRVDIADLRDHLEDLKEEKMNGRQIRNAITTARQYAEWKGTTLTYEHLKDVIEVSGRFDKYLDQLNGGYTQDQIAEGEGLRLA